LAYVHGISRSYTPDLKVLIEPADHSSIVAANGPAQFVPAAQLEQSRQQLAALQSHVEQAVDEYKSKYPVNLKFDYTFKANEAPPSTFSRFITTTSSPTSRPMRRRSSASTR
jgi:hypothetical protein